ncbi:MAG TPA: PspC domain-containing protein [Actinomycetales bacterium]|nr:PspC domain-containing protein [Actinomycetales bacterium]
MPSTVPRPPLVRPVRDRLIGGVAAGLAAHLEQPVQRVRWAFAILTLIFGAGAMAYVLLWMLVPPAAPVSAAGPTPARGRTRGTEADTRQREAAGPTSRVAFSWSEHGPQVGIGAGLAAVGISALARRAGADVNPVTVAAITVIFAGVLIAWRQLDAAERHRWLATAGGDTRAGVVRLAAGVVVAVFGIVLLVSGQVDPVALRAGVLAAGAVLVGVGLLVAPWLLRLGRELVAERSARIRETERAEIAAHLHDSVLQTLALIQRRSTDPAEVSRLARGQERELRQWLYASGERQRPEGESGGLAAAVRDAVAEVEDTYGVPVDVVAVGDADLDADTHALVLALREAVLNAVRHGAPPVSVYLEAGAGVEAFVRDHGSGVDLDQVPTDRMGLRESVIGRMARHGGRASVRKVPAGGTEVALSLASNGSGEREQA